MGGTASLLVDVDVSQRLDLIVQDLRSRGVDARALQGRSQIEINAHFGFAEEQGHDGDGLDDVIAPGHRQERPGHQEDVLVQGQRRSAPVCDS